MVACEQAATLKLCTVQASRLTWPQVCPSVHPKRPALPVPSM